ncbi:hypothetical protein COV94_07230 [Candidatus Woesearchaeota archaeon CG11_big_fil_rev_8_21_14_0_20_57_5]|nr:MAG: hypothetical protein COV94_07230 [Candidatus Woesearchaeota archaeon CG11_big_fil_rev_8_21_14_0_20_57_5]
MKRFNLSRAIATLGYLSVSEYLLKFALPTLGTSIACAVVFAFIPITRSLAAIPLVLGTLFMIVYPFGLFLNKKTDIDGNLHFFITYAGTVSTMKINRTVLFRLIASKRAFGEISKIAEKIFYLAKKWTMGFPKTCKRIGALSPSEAFADFLDRFAVAMDFGQDIETFLLEEQDAVMDAYELEYKKSLESIRMIESLFTSLTVAIAFMLSISLLMPLLMGISLEVIAQYAILTIVVIDGVILFLVKALVPADKICHNLQVKDPGMRKVRLTVLITAPISAILLIILVFFTRLPFLVGVAIGATPLIIPGWLATREEQDVLRRDTFFPAFVRSLGSAVRARNGAMLSSLKIILVHDFGPINDMMHNLYRRLRVGSEKFECWLFFAGESGSHLIQHFSKIFSESIYLGGDGEKVGEIVSRNFQRLVSLRMQRLQLASGLKGALYGSLVGFSASIYVTAKISEIIGGVFSSPMQGASNMQDVLGGISPNLAATNMDRVLLLIGILIIVHSVISSVIVKLVDGGMLSASFVDLVFMLWIGAVLSVVIPAATQNIIPGFGSMLG